MKITIDMGEVSSHGSQHQRLPGIAVAASASIAAGAIHAAATGVHAEHPDLARIFVLCAVAQMGVGLWALIQPRRAGALSLAIVNGVAVAGWIITRIAGISWIEGLEVREAPQFADAACAALGAVAAGAAIAALLVGWVPGRPQRMLLPGLAAAALAIPAMIAGGTHVHSDNHGAVASVDGTSAASEGDGHDPAHGDTATSSASAAASGSAAGGDESASASVTTLHSHDTAPANESSVSETTVHDHGDTAAAVSANWPRSWDPTQPIDLSGVAGVSAEQQARAEALVEQTLIDLPRWSTTAEAVADGYTSIGDAGTGSEHYIKPSLIQDDVILDPTQPESLVYTVDGDQRTLAGAMFIAKAQPTDSPELVDWAGPLMQWHNHGNLCWDRDAAGVAKVVGIVDANGVCARGVNTGGANPMVHVWITAHPCGVFAALEGVGAGQASVPEDQRVDMCLPAHDHIGAATPDQPAQAIAPTPYDPTKPIDLSGTPGVTPEQQAAAENLVAVTVVRLPQWADHRTAEAAGFHSIGDGATGAEHFINWDWINDDVTLDPDHPESLVYRPQPDGTKQLVSAMYMLPDTVGLDEVPELGGALTQWHIHDNLCFNTDPVARKVAGLTNAQGGCPPGLVKFQPASMIHVWIVPHECGPFAALDGVGAGQIADGETRLCDHAHGDGLL